MVIDNKTLNSEPTSLVFMDQHNEIRQCQKFHFTDKDTEQKDLVIRPKQLVCCKAHI